MANALLTPTIIAKEAMMQLENNLVMAKLVHRDYKNEFVKIGSSVSIRRPVKFTVTDGATRSNQDVEEGNTSLTIDKRKHVSWKFSTQDLTLTVEEYSKRYVEPAMIALANQVDRDVLGLYTNVWNWVGTPGQTIDSFADLAKGPQRLDEGAVPTDMRRAVLSPADNWAMAGNLTGLQLVKDSNQAYRKGLLGNVAGLDMYMDQNVVRHTVGAHGGTPLVNGASQNVTYAASKTTWTQSLVTDGWTNSITGIVKAGDVFTIAGVFAVNPVSKAALDYLQEFVVTADADSGATTGPATLTISPPIITSGPYQTVSAVPADNAAITVKGTASTLYPQNLVFHKNAFALVTVPLEMPDSAGWKARETHNGVSIRLVKDYDIDADEEIIRADILYGVKAIYPDLATRISGTA